MNGYSIYYKNYIIRIGGDNQYLAPVRFSGNKKLPELLY
jgi:hypothetical protein